MKQLSTIYKINSFARSVYKNVEHYLLLTFITRNLQKNKKKIGLKINEKNTKYVVVTRNNCRVGLLDYWLMQI